MGQNKIIVRRFFDEVVNGRKLEVVDELIASDFTDHNVPPGTPKGPEGMKQFLKMVGTAFPDLHITIEDMLEDGEKVIVRLSVRGTHKGDLMSIPPTGKQATWAGIDIIRIANGMMVERWGLRDFMSLMQQLGIVQPPGEK